MQQRYRVGHLVMAGIVLSGCVSNAPQLEEMNQAVYVKVGNFHPAEDVNPAADVVEVALTAEVKQLSLGQDPSVKTDVWVYNGQLPGPMIRARVGDTLIVHFTNNLPEQTTIHWHGVDVPAVMDGTELSAATVQPGETFTYTFPLLRAGTYWYHPHVRSNVQVERGLYGALVVTDPDGEAGLDLPEDTYVLVLDDILVDADGVIAPPFAADPIANAVSQVNGREGNTLLVNGARNPNIKVRAQQPIRLRVINTANARFMRLSVAGHTLWRIGGDGGLIPQARAVPPINMVQNGDGELVSDPDPARGIVLTPGERADLVFTPTGDPGDVLELQWHDWARGKHMAAYDDNGAIVLHHAHHEGGRPPVPLMTFEIRHGAVGPGEWLPPAQLTSIEPIDVSNAITLPVRFGHSAPDVNGDVTFFATMIGGKGVPFAQLAPDQGLHVTVGQTGVWEVTNLTGGDHNFHPHGFSFQPIETEFVDLDNPDNNVVVPADQVEVKDTIRVPRRPGAFMRSRTIVRLAARFDDAGREGSVLTGGKTPTADHSGGWFVHCHLLEHVARGMGTFLAVTAAEP